MLTANRASDAGMTSNTLCIPSHVAGDSHQCKNLASHAAVALLDAAMHQPDSNAVAEADMRPCSFAKPTVGLNADEREKGEKTAVADDGANAGQHSQHAQFEPSRLAARRRTSLDFEANDTAGFTLQIGGVQQTVGGLQIDVDPINIAVALAIGDPRIEPQGL